MDLTDTASGIFHVEFFGPGVIAAFSGRNYDNLKREEFLTKLKLDSSRLVMVKQVHGSTVLTVKAQDPSLLDVPADGLITKAEDLALGIRTADCVPVFFWDPVRKVAGIAHGGWRGVKDGLMSRMLNVFERDFGTDLKDLKIVFGPSIRKCCYEVGKEFLGYFPGFYHAKDANKGYLDLIAVLRGRFIKRGVLAQGIYDTGLCTVCENKKFFSYRAEKNTQQRILSVICIDSRRAS